MVRPTVQVVVVPEFNVEGEHDSEANTAGATRVREALFELPFAVAVSCAVASALMAATVAVKPALV